MERTTPGCAKLDLVEWFPAFLTSATGLQLERGPPLVRLGRQLNRPCVIIPEAGHEPWLEQPDLFRHEFRSAVRAAASPAS